MIILQPPYYLRSCIDFFWYGTEEADRCSIRSVKLIPDGKHGLILQHYNGKSVSTDETGRFLPVGFVYGQSSSPLVCHIHGSITKFGVYFKPHAIKDIFKIGADRLVDAFVDLDDLAEDKISDVLLSLRDPLMIYECLCNLFWKKLNSYGKEDKIIEDCILRIQENIGDVKPSSIYREYKLSKRQFQRRFKERVGIHLGTYIRIVKFQKSLRLLHSETYNKFSDIAYSLGYADQSHFIRDFKFFTDITPKDVLNKEVIFPENVFPAYPVLDTRRRIFY